MRYLLPLVMALPLVASATESHRDHRRGPDVVPQAQSVSNNSVTQSVAVDNAVSLTANSSVTASPSQANSQNVTLTSPDRQTIKNTPGLFTGGLTSSMDTCLGSASGGVAAPGFGFTLGGTTVDKNCVMRKNADMLYRMGMIPAAIALVCGEDESIRRALEQTGYVCPVK